MFQRAISLTVSSVAFRQSFFSTSRVSYGLFRRFSTSHVSYCFLRCFSTIIFSTCLSASHVSYGFLRRFSTSHDAYGVLCRSFSTFHVFQRAKLLTAFPFFFRQSFFQRTVFQRAMLLTGFSEAFPTSRDAYGLLRCFSQRPMFLTVLSEALFQRFIFFNEPFYAP